MPADVGVGAAATGPHHDTRAWIGSSGDITTEGIDIATIEKVSKWEVYDIFTYIYTE